MRQRIENAIVESLVEDHTDLNDLTNKLLDLYIIMLSESETNPRDKAEEILNDHRLQAAFVAGAMHERLTIEKHFRDHSS